MGEVCLFAIFKDESHIIKEWLEHYLNEGVDHFFLIDNGSTDDYKTLIEPHMDKITLFVDQAKYQQPELYNKYVFPNIKRYEWVIGVDLDEFMWSVETKTIKECLSELSDDVGLIKIPQEQYGSSGHEKQPKHVVESFLYRQEGTYGTATKCIGRTKYIKNLHVHHFEIEERAKILDSCFNDFISDTKWSFEISETHITNSKLRMAHYRIQSFEWFTDIKSKRGNVFTKEHEEEKNTYEYFKSSDNNDKLDNSLYLKNHHHSSQTLIRIVSLIFVFLLVWVLFRS